MKRAFDLVVGAVVLLLAAPVMGVIAVLVAVRLGRPVLFRQIRPGYQGRMFELVKFRTMTDGRGSDGALLPDAERLTPLGRWLRATSLDELPALWCVLRGDMSLVGPRPLLPEYLGRYSREQARRHEVKPGITGWAQVNGRNALDWSTRFTLDVWYVDHQSFMLDLRILWRTVSAVLSRRGITHEGDATMPTFRGDGGEA